MTYAYLDTNVYNDIERGGVPADDVRDVQAAVKRGEVVVRAGLVDLEEALGLWRTDRPAALRRLGVIRGLAGFDKFLNQPSDLLAGAIQAYAARASGPPSPLLPRPMRRDLAANLEKITAGRGDFDQIVDEILARVRAQKEGVLAGMAAGREKTLAELHARYRPDQLRTLPFDGFFKTGALGWAEDYAAGAERNFGPTDLVDACRARGLDGLLQVPPVRLIVGMTLSLIHAQISTGRQPEIGDAYDLWHAIQASTADVFVTSDQRFVDHMTRIPGTGLSVVKSLREALAVSRARSRYSKPSPRRAPEPTARTPGAIAWPSGEGALKT